MFSNKYIQYLADKTKNESFVDKLKIKFRPLIFPVKSLLAWVDKNDRVFDIGCGSGQFLLLANEFKKVSTVYGVEIDEKLVNNANSLFEKHTKNVTYQFFQYQGSTLPKEISECNKVFLNDVFHHIPKDQQMSFLQHIYDSMKEGATFVFKDINASSILVYCNKLHDLIFAGEIGKEISFQNARSLLESVGFRVKSTELKTIAVYPHYTIICEK